MPLNSGTGTLFTLQQFAHICLMTYNLSFQNSGSRKQRCLSFFLPQTLLASFLSHVCWLSKSALGWQLQLSIHIHHFRDSIQPPYLSSVYISSTCGSIIHQQRFKDITATWMLNLRGNNNGTLSSYISSPPNHIGLYSRGHQPNNTCLNTQKERKTEWSVSGFLDPEMCVYLCLASAYSSWFGKPSWHILIPSKTPLQCSCCRTK